MKQSTKFFAYLFIPVWGINIFSDGEIWEYLEKVILSLFMIMVSVRIVLEAKKSNEDGKPCSNLIEQLTFAITPKQDSDTPYKRMEYFGYFSGITSVILLFTVITGLIG